MKNFLQPLEQRVLYIMLFTGLLSVIFGFLYSDRFWAAFLHNSYYFLTIALGSAVFIAINHVANSSWSSVLRRVPEAMMSYIPIGAITMLFVFLGRNTLYEWTATSYSHNGHALGFKNAYLNTEFFLIRMLVILASWILIVFLLRRESVAQDSSADIAHTNRSKAYSALFLVVFGLTFTFASIDWIMSLEPMFFSTIYGFYHIAGVLLSGSAAITVLTILLRRRGFLKSVGDKQMHSLGKLVLGFATFWAYIWVCQYILIYYANMPEETFHYVRRTAAGGWWYIFILSLFLNWLIPFVMLLQKKVKFKENWMLAACGIVLIGHWTDLYVLIFPTFFSDPMIGLVDIGLPIGFTALFLFVFLRMLDAASLTPKNDPYLEESIWQEP